MVIFIVSKLISTEPLLCLFEFFVLFFFAVGIDAGLAYEFFDGYYIMEERSV